MLTRKAVQRIAPRCNPRDGRVAHVFELTEQVSLKTANRKVLRGAVCVNNLFFLLSPSMADVLVILEFIKLLRI